MDILFISLGDFLTVCLVHCIRFSFNSLPTGKFSYFLSSTDFFSKSTFQKINSGIPSKCQTDWIQTRPDILSGLIWVQTV